MTNELLHDYVSTYADSERTYYEYHGKLDDGICIVDICESIHGEGSV